MASSGEAADCTCVRELTVAFGLTVDPSQSHVLMLLYFFLFSSYISSFLDQYMNKKLDG